MLETNKTLELQDSNREALEHPNNQPVFVVRKLVEGAVIKEAPKPEEAQLMPHRKMDSEGNILDPEDGKKIRADVTLFYLPSITIFNYNDIINLCSLYRLMFFSSRTGQMKVRQVLADVLFDQVKFLAYVEEGICSPSLKSIVNRNQGRMNSADYTEPVVEYLKSSIEMLKELIAMLGKKRDSWKKLGAVKLTIEQEIAKVRKIGS